MSTGRLTRSARFPAEGAEGSVDVREVRAYVRDVVGVGHPRWDDIEVMTSEIVTNACRHTASGVQGGRLLVDVVCDAGSVCVSFTDDGGAEGAPPLPELIGLDAVDVGAESGRGLFIVAALADKWGWRPEESSSLTVWFEVGTAAGNAR